MKSSLQLAIAIALAASLVEAQIKTSSSGIKTHHAAALNNTGNLILGNSTHESREWHEYGGPSLYPNLPSEYKPAEYYVPGDERHFVATTRPPPPQLDPTAEFINKTRAGMASGICYKEVPTASLSRHLDVLPAGNGTSPDMSRIQVCCEGYQRNPHIYSRCDPICHDDCPNGICTAPNTCVCIPGHVRNYEDKCISVCPLGCGHGICDEMGECRCRPGYTIEPKERKYCVPHCEQGCEFGKCVAPDRCDCFEGYRLTGSGTCEPRCDNCENGRCTSPGFCSCNEGYIKVGSVCEPVCSKGCNKGSCIAPETCQCPSGFALDATRINCVPHCDRPCLNGVCAGDNTCTCNEGYINDERQPNICRPNCPQGCPNGYCTAPNLCICRPGYVKSGVKGRQTCLPV